MAPFLDSKKNSKKEKYYEKETTEIVRLFSRFHVESFKNQEEKKEKETDRWSSSPSRSQCSSSNLRRLLSSIFPPSTNSPPIPSRRIFKRPWRSSETRLCRLGHWIHRHGKPILPWKEANSFTWPRPPPRTRIPARKSCVFLSLFCLFLPIYDLSFFFFSFLGVYRGWIRSIICRLLEQFEMI